MINFARFEFEELTDFSAVQEKNKAFIDECVRLKKESDEYATKNYLLNSKKIEQKKAIDDVKFIYYLKLFFVYSFHIFLI